ncbi:fungal hydrophobin-domain-containing protein [Fomes fomentarius]|nr:fungal hydrophobin-domain-containing protein [Fomes fomentarius]
MFAKLSIFSVVALAVATYGAPCATESDGISVSAGLSATVSGVAPTGVQPTGDNPAPTPTIPGSPPLIPGLPSLIPGLPSLIPGLPSLIPGLPSLIPGLPSLIPLPVGPTGGNPGDPPVPTTIPGVSGVPGAPHPTSTSPSETQSAKPTEVNPPSPSPTDGQPGNPPYGQPGNDNGNGGNGGSKCSTGPVQCCNRVVDPSSQEHKNALSTLLGVPVGDVKGMVGLNCSPINVIGVASGNDCKTQTVCCNSSAKGGFVNIGCVPITL